MQTLPALMCARRTDDNIVIIRQSLARALDDFDKFSSGTKVQRRDFDVFYQNLVYWLQTRNDNCENFFYCINSMQANSKQLFAPVECLHILISFAFPSLDLRLPSYNYDFITFYDFAYYLHKVVDKDNFLPLLRNYNLSKELSVGGNEILGENDFIASIIPCLELDVDFDIKLNLAGIDVSESSRAIKLKDKFFKENLKIVENVISQLVIERKELSGLAFSHPID